MIKDAIKKSEKEAKLFYSYIKSKPKKKEQISIIANEGVTNDNQKDMSEIPNKNFQSVFTKEPSFDVNQETPTYTKTETEGDRADKGTTTKGTEDP